MAPADKKTRQKAEKVTAAEIVDALTDRFSDTRQYVRGFEVGVTTGGGCRRIDCVVMDCYASHGFRVEGIEIKISRADLRRELENSEKHALFYENLDYFSLAAPSDIIDRDIIPPHWGIYEYFGGSLTLTRKPLMLHDPPMETMSKGFAASFMRSAAYRQHSQSDIAQAAREAEQEAFKRGREAAERELGGFMMHDNLERLARYDEMFGHVAGRKLDELEALAALVSKTSLLYLHDELKHFDKNIRYIMRLLKNEAGAE